jgi:hypothetical protein
MHSGRKTSAGRVRHRHAPYTLVPRSGYAVRENVHGRCVRRGRGTHVNALAAGARRTGRPAFAHPVSDAAQPARTRGLPARHGRGCGARLDTPPIAIGRRASSRRGDAYDAPRVPGIGRGLHARTARRLRRGDEPVRGGRGRARGGGEPSTAEAREDRRRGVARRAGRVPHGNPGQRRGEHPDRPHRRGWRDHFPRQLLGLQRGRERASDGRGAPGRVPEKVFLMSRSTAATPGAPRARSTSRSRGSGPTGWTSCRSTR